MVVVPSCAVTKAVMVFDPTANTIAPEALPEGTAFPFTVIAAVTSDAVGVTVSKVTPFTTFAVYVVVPVAKAGVKVPLLILNADRLALADGALVTVRVYVLVVAPSWAVTTVVMAFNPAFNAIGADAVPDATVMPFTFTVDVGTAVNGVMVIVAAPFTTSSVYANLDAEKVGDKLPALGLRFDK